MGFIARFYLCVTGTLSENLNFTTVYEVVSEREGNFERDLIRRNLPNDLFWRMIMVNLSFFLFFPHKISKKVTDLYKNPQTCKIASEYCAVTRMLFFCLFVQADDNEEHLTDFYFSFFGEGARG